MEHTHLSHELVQNVAQQKFIALVYKKVSHDM